MRIRWFNAMHLSPMADPPLFKVRYSTSDEYYRASLWIDWRWLGIGHWLIIWLPDFMP
jgi:hypothetical protein